MRRRGLGRRAASLALITMIATALGAGPAGASTDGETGLVVGQEFSAPDAPIGRAPEAQWTPAVAAGGDVSLVVWEDDRYGRDIQATRVDAAGTVLDRGGLVVADSWFAEHTPAVAWNGVEFLVVAVRPDQSLCAGYCPEGSIHLARVRADGESVGESTRLGWGAEPGVACAPESCLVVWWTYDTKEIVGVRIGSDGAVLDDPPRLLASAAGRPGSPAVAWGGSSYLVVWHEVADPGRDVKAQRVSVAGDPIGAAIIVAARATDEGDPSVASNGDSFLIVWEDARSGVNDVYATRLAADGAFLDAEPFLVSGHAAPEDQPVVSAGATEYVVVWQQWSASIDTRAARVAPSGAVLDPEGITLSETEGNEHAPAIAWSGSSYLVPWVRSSLTETSNIWGARLDSNGTILDAEPFLVSYGYALQVDPVVASAEDVALSVWVEQAEDATTILGARIDQSGALLDPDPITIAVTAVRLPDLAVASDGKTFLVVWKGRTDPRASALIVGARVSAEGELLDSSPIIISEDLYRLRRPALAWGEGAYLVVWERYYDDSYDIWGTRVAADGRVLNPDGVRLTGGEHDELRPTVAAGNDGWVVVWNDIIWSCLTVLCSVGHSSISGVRTSSSGHPLHVIKIADTFYSETSPSIAFDGWGFLVGWQDWGVMGASVTQDSAGSLLSVGYPFRIASLPSDPAIEWVGENYLVVAGRAVRVSPGYEVLDATPVSIGPGAASVAPVAPGRAMILSSRRVRERPYGNARRVFYRGVDDPTEDTVAPETTITGGPTGSADTGVTFEFESSERRSTTMCALDGASFAPCTSPTTLSGLKAGTHTFRVQATDAAGNVDPTPAEVTWYAEDRSPPVLVLRQPTSGVWNGDVPVAPLPGGAIVLAGASTVQYQAFDPESDIVAFALLIDGTTVDPSEISFDAATATYSYRWSPSTGQHILEAAATNGEGLQTRRAQNVTAVSDEDGIDCEVLCVENDVLPLEVLAVDARESGTTPTRPLAAGELHEIEVFGRYAYFYANPALAADARCATLDGISWAADPLGDGLLSLEIDGAPVGWEPSPPAAVGDARCSPAHRYRTTIVGEGIPIELRIRDGGYDDNLGWLLVAIKAVEQ